MPANLAALRALGALGQTLSWTVGQYVVLGDASEAYWDSAQWQVGRTPAPIVDATGALEDPGVEGTWTPAGAQAPATFATLVAGIPETVVADPVTAWSTDSFVACRNADQAHWDGTDWVAGAAP